MRRVVALYRSSVGKKVLMAVSGFIWFGFLLGHMAGNLKAFTGAEHFNEYAHFLREMRKCPWFRSTSSSGWPAPS